MRLHLITSFLSAAVLLGGCEPSQRQELKTFRLLLDNQRDRSTRGDNCLAYLSSQVGSVLEVFPCGTAVDEWQYRTINPPQGQFETFTHLGTGPTACLETPIVSTDRPSNQFCSSNFARQTWNFLQGIEIFFTTPGSNETADYWCLTAPAALSGRGHFPATVSKCAGRPAHQQWTYLPIQRRITYGGAYWLAKGPASGQVVLTSELREAETWTYLDDGQLRASDGTTLGSVNLTDLTLVTFPQLGQKWFFRGHIRNGWGMYLVPQNTVSEGVQLRPGTDPRTNHGWPPQPERPDEALFRIWPMLGDGR